MKEQWKSLARRMKLKERGGANPPSFKLFIIVGVLTVLLIGREDIIALIEPYFK